MEQRFGSSNTNSNATLGFTIPPLQAEVKAGSQMHTA